MKALFLAALLPFSSLAATTVKCPIDYPTALMSAKVPSGWDGVANVTGLRLVVRFAGVIVGDPTQAVQASLIPTEEVKTKTGVRFTFAYLDKFTQPQPKWVYCAYGQGNNVQLIKRVPDNVSTCISDVHMHDGSVQGVEVTCH